MQSPLNRYISNFKYTRDASPTYPRIQIDYDRLKDQLLDPVNAISLEWQSVYSSLLDGFSKGVFLSRMRLFKPPFLFIIEDTLCNVFGSFVDKPVCIQRGCFGTSKCFLFKMCHKSLFGVVDLDRPFLEYLRVDEAYLVRLREYQKQLRKSGNESDPKSKAGSNGKTGNESDPKFKAGANGKSGNEINPKSKVEANGKTENHDKSKSECNYEPVTYTNHRKDTQPLDTQTDHHEPAQIDIEESRSSTISVQPSSMNPNAIDIGRQPISKLPESMGMACASNIDTLSCLSSEEGVCSRKFVGRICESIFVRSIFKPLSFQTPKPSERGTSKDLDKYSTNNALTSDRDRISGRITSDTYDTLDSVNRPLDTIDPHVTGRMTSDTLDTYDTLDSVSRPLDTINPHLPGTSKTVRFGDTYNPVCYDMCQVYKHLTVNRNSKTVDRERQRSTENTVCKILQEYESVSEKHTHNSMPRVPPLVSNRNAVCAIIKRVQSVNEGTIFDSMHNNDHNNMPRDDSTTQPYTRSDMPHDMSSNQLAHSYLVYGLPQSKRTNDLSPTEPPYRLPVPKEVVSQWESKALRLIKKKSFQRAFSQRLCDQALLSVFVDHKNFFRVSEEEILPLKVNGFVCNCECDKLSAILLQNGGEGMDLKFEDSHSTDVGGSQSIHESDSNSKDNRDSHSICESDSHSNDEGDSHTKDKNGSHLICEHFHKKKPIHSILKALSHHSKVPNAKSNRTHHKANENRFNSVMKEITTEFENTNSLRVKQVMKKVEERIMAENELTLDPRYEREYYIVRDYYYMVNKASKHKTDALKDSNTYPTKQCTYELDTQIIGKDILDSKTLTVLQKLSIFQSLGCTDITEGEFRMFMANYLKRSTNGEGTREDRDMEAMGCMVKEDKRYEQTKNISRCNDGSNHEGTGSQFGGYYTYLESPTTIDSQTTIESRYIIDPQTTIESRNIIDPQTTIESPTTIDSPVATTWGNKVPTQKQTKITIIDNPTLDNNNNRDTSNNKYNSESNNTCNNSVDGINNKYNENEDYFFRKYPATGKNNYHIWCTKDILAFGCSDGKFGLFLDGTMGRGESYCVETYDNEVLSGGNSFTVKRIEVWSIRE